MLESRPSGDPDPAGRADWGLLTKLLYILSPREKRQLAIIFPAVVVMALLDVVGIASIVPFLGLLSDPDAIEESRILSWAYHELGFDSRESFFFLVGAGVLVVLTLGNAFATVTTWALLRFSWMRNHSLSTRLLEGYLARPYEFFLTRNTSELSQKTLSEVQQVVSGVVVQCMQLGARTIVIAFILGGLVLVDPGMALAVGVTFGGLYGGLFWTVKRKLTILGKQRVAANRERFKLASEMLTGIKEVKLAGLEGVFLARYARPSERFARTIATTQTLSQIPKYTLETVAFGGILVMVLYLLHQGRPLAGVLPVLGLYAFASYRMLPALQIVFAGLSQLRANLAALDTLIADLGPASDGRAGSARAATPLPYERCVALEHVSFRYPSTECEVLRDLSLRIDVGEWVAFVGPTGSGKSTLVDLLLGLLAPHDGVLKVDDVVIDDANVARWQRHAGYVPQHIFLADDTVAHNIAFGDDDARMDEDRLRAAARVAQIAAFIEGELPNGYASTIGERGIRLSGGQRQRIGIARALYRRSRLLVLDEATSALDGATEERFFEELRREHRDCTVISIAHRLTTTRHFDRIYVLEKGEIVDFGNFEELRARSRHFSAHRESGA